MESNWLEKLFINEAKPALKRHSGSGAGKEPVLTELIVTENGVYDEPVIGGELDFSAGSTITFKHAPTIDDIPAELHSSFSGSGKAIYTGAAGAYHVTIFNGGLSITIAKGGENFTYLDEIITQLLGVHMGVSEPGWYSVDTTTSQTTKLDQPVSFTIDAGGNTEMLVACKDLFQAPSTPADGWNKVTVNVPSSGGAELNIAYGDTPPEDTSKLWVKTDAPSKVSVAEPVYVSELPTESKVSSEAKYQKGSGGVRIGTKIYRVGECSGSSAMNKTTVFDIETGIFEDVPMPVGVEFQYMTYGYGYSCSAVASKIYAFGGTSSLYNAGSYHQTGPIVLYDTETSTWRKLETGFGRTVGGATCEAVGTSIYIFGGSGNNSYYQTICRFDTETEVLTTLSTIMPVPASYIGSVAIGTNIYLFGGEYNAYSQSRKNAYCFDTETESITSIAALPVSATRIGCCEMNNIIYLFGGYLSGYSSGHSAIYSYDVDANTYELLDIELLVPGESLVCETINDRIYIVGPNFAAYLFTLSPQLDEDELRICPEVGKDIVKVVNTESFSLEVPVSKVFLGNNIGTSDPIEVARHDGNEWVTI